MRLLRRMRKAAIKGLRSFIGGQSEQFAGGIADRDEADHINESIDMGLENMRRRCLRERKNNALVTGIVETYADDLVGVNGPTLQIQSSDKRFNTLMETAWKRFAESPDIASDMAFPDMLRLWVNQLFGMGEIVVQKRIELDGFKIRNIDPRQLGADSVMHQPNVLQGIERDAMGRPETYHFVEYPGGSVDTSQYGRPRSIPAKEIVHWFKRMEPGQVRGVPWLHPCIETIYHLRDFDDALIKAAKLCARFGIMLFADHPDAEFIDIGADDKLTLKQGSMNIVPQGWKSEQMKPETPTAELLQMRKERLRELGRPVGMPLLKILADASDHNYSSARLDMQGFQRGLEATQGALNRGLLNQFVRGIHRVELLSRRLTRPWPADAVLVWTWPKLPHVDPNKEAQAAERLYLAGLASLAELCAARGVDWEVFLEQLKTESAALKSAGFADPRDPEKRSGDGIISQPIMRAIQNYVHSVVEREIEEAIAERTRSLAT